MNTKATISKRTAAFLTFLLINSVVLLHAADKTNFTGTWTLNSDKSELGERGRADLMRTVKQEENKLTVESKSTGRDGEERTTTSTYTLDGKESVNPGFGNSERKSVVKWIEEGKKLSIKTTMEFNRNGESRVFETTETWELSSDGKTLTVISSSQRGDRKMVYDLK